MYILLLVIIYLAFTGMGLSTSLMGSAWPVMQVEFAASLNTVSISSMIVSASTVLVSLFADRLFRRSGTGIVTAVGMAIISGSMFGFAVSGSEAMLYIFSVPFGIGTGMIDAIINNYVANHYSARHMSWLHCFWSFGSVISPFIMGGFMETDNNWRGGYIAVAIIQAAVVIILIASSFLWKANGTSFLKAENAAAQESKPVSFREIFKLRGIWLILFSFTAYCAFQRTIMLWASSYLVGMRGIAEDTAATYASLVFIGVTAGRFISGLIADRLGDRRMIRYGLYVTVLGVICLLVPVDSEPLAVAGLIVIGLGAAPGYPSIVHATPDNFGTKYSQSVIGLEIAFAYIGTTFMPSLFGVIAEKTSLAVLPYYILFFALLMLVLTEIFNRMKDRG